MIRCSSLSIRANKAIDGLVAGSEVGSYLARAGTDGCKCGSAIRPVQPILGLREVVERLPALRSQLTQGIEQTQTRLRFNGANARDWCGADASCLLYRVALVAGGGEAQLVIVPASQRALL